MIPTTREEAKTAGADRYYPTTPCKTGHIYARRTTTGQCILCHRSRARQWQIDNPGRYKANLRSWYEANAETAKARTKRWRADNPDRKRAQSKKDAKQNRLAINIRARMRQALSRLPASEFRPRAGVAIRCLGCSLEEFRGHIESLFVDGMRWESWGRDGWHLDHIRPLISFNLHDREQLQEACHYSNYQPLWAKDNLRKSADDKRLRVPSR